MAMMTNYLVATEWLNNSMIRIDNFEQIDPTIVDNARFSFFRYEAEDGEIYEDEYEIPDGLEWESSTIDIFQWYLTDCSDMDVKYLEENFGLLFSYSSLLERYVLAVDHWGTAWDYVPCETKNEYAIRKLGERK